jgi:integrase
MILTYTYTMALPKFYIEKRKDKKTGKVDTSGAAPINMFFSIYGERLQWFTGIRLEFKYYKAVDPITGETKLNAKGEAYDLSDVNKLISDSAPYAKVIKDNLKQVALDVQTIANYAKSNRIPVTKEYLKTELDKIHKHKEAEKPSKLSHDFISFYEQLIHDYKSGERLMQKGKKAGQHYSPNAIKNYGTTLSAVKRYLKAYSLKSLPFEEINKTFYDKFKRFCYGPGEEKEISTFAGYIKDIKSAMNEAAEAGFHTTTGHKSSSFIMPSYEADTKALTLDEVDLILNHDFTGKPRLERVRDLFCVGCLTALRFSNYNNLKIENIENGFIRVKQVKTGDLVTIPIMSRLRTLLDKYDGSFPAPVSNQEFNRVIKEVVKEAGLTYTVSVKSHNGGQAKVTQVPIYTLISSHTARRTYATIMFKLNVRTSLIMAATGHRTESSFLTYIKATNEDKAKLMAAEFERLGL